MTLKDIISGRTALLLGVVCFGGCASQQLTPAQLQAQGLARVQVESLAKWNLNLPRGGFEVQITAIDGKSTCHGNACVVTVLVPPGPTTISVLCLLDTGGLRIPKASGEYRGDLRAGHVYGIRPLSPQTDCRLALDDVTSEAK